jgi:inhibitor of cysteine peptidase
MTRLAAPFAAVLALAGCAGVGQNLDWPELTSNPREFFNLNPPVRLAAGEPIASPVVLKTGQALIVKLPEDPATGYTWRLRELPRGAVVAPVQHDFTAVSGGDPAPAGSGGEATFRLRAVAPGTQAVTLDQVRPGFATPAKSVAFDVTVR